MSIEVRQVQKEDIPMLVEMGKDLHTKTGQEDRQYDPLSVASSFGQALDSPHGFALVAVSKGAICGFLAASMTPLFWHSGEKVCFEVGFQVEKHFRRLGAGKALIEAFEQEAASRGASTVYMHSLEADEDAERLCALLGRMGYKSVERIHLKAMR